MKTLEHRCDICFNRNKGCDRRIPKCSYCLKNNLECVIRRKTFRSNKSHKYEDKISVFKISSIQSSNHSSSKYETVERKEDNSNVIVRGLTDKTSKAASAILLVIPTKQLRDNLLQFLQYPNARVFNNNMKLMISISAKLSSIAKRNRKMELLPFKSIQNENQNVLLTLIQGFQHYFRYEHPMLPIFDLTQFNFNKCNVYLKLAIIASGLINQPRNDLISQLLKYIERILFNEFKNIYRNKPSIITIQTIIVILFGLREFKWVLRCTKSMLHYLITSTHSLGLHITKSNSNNYNQNQNLYSIISYILSYFSFSSFLLYPSIYKHCSNLIIQCYFDSQVNYINYLNTIFNSVLLNHGYYFYKLNIIKVKIAEEVSKYSEERHKIHCIIQAYAKSHLSQLNMLNKAESIQIKYKNLNLINFYKTHAILLFNYFEFSSKCLSLYHSPIEIPPSTILPIMNLAVKCVSCVTNLPLVYINHNITSILFQSLIFLIRYNKFNDLQFIWYRGLDIFKSLSQEPFNSEAAKLSYQVLLETIKLV